jgi:hypothetical protein
MALEQFGHAIDLFINGQSDQSDDRAVWQSANEDQFAEVFILGHEHALFGKRHGHKPLVAGLGINGDSGHYIVALTDEEGLQ